MTNLEINNLTTSRVDKEFLQKVAKGVFKSIKLREIREISVAIVGDAKIKNLNKKYRKKDKVTDVLAFDYGEIFICLSQAKRQAKKIGHSIKNELAILLIHGILHLAGYRDKTKKDRERMNKIQENIWRKLI
jgi:probable rRNA maturation factor